MARNLMYVEIQSRGQYTQTHARGNPLDIQATDSHALGAGPGFWAAFGDVLLLHGVLR